MQHLDSFMQFQPDGVQCYLFPPLTALCDFQTKQVKVGVQNAYPTYNGSVTGEVGAMQLEEFGIKTVLIGHSERRTLLNESQELIAKKFAYYKQLGYEIIYCIGEDLDTRQNGDVEQFLQGQLEGIDLEYEKLIVAYEPVWAIGTGQSASSETIVQTHKMIKQMITKVPLLYGGSVKPDSAQSICSLEGVDGVLVGSASLQVESFQEIITNSL